MDTNKDMKTREKDLLAKEAELNRREKEIKRREEAAARAGIVLEDKNWPPFFPIIHHDIGNEIPVHLQRTQYVAFASLLGLVLCLFWNIICVSAAWAKGSGMLTSIAFSTHALVTDVYGSRPCAPVDAEAIVILFHYL
jgi:hypothetical protein